MYKSSFNVNPSDIYRGGLSSIPSEQFPSGNRYDAGQSKKVHHEMLTLQEKLKKNDETECLVKGLTFRNIHTD